MLALPMRSVRHRNHQASSLEPAVEVVSATRCIKAPPGTEYSELSPDGRSDDIVTLDECAVGDLVFADLDVSMKALPLWPLYEVVE